MEAELSKTSASHSFVAILLRDTTAPKTETFVPKNLLWTGSAETEKLL